MTAINHAIKLPEGLYSIGPNGRIRFDRYTSLGSYPIVYTLVANGRHGGMRYAYVCRDCAAATVDYDPSEAHPTDLWWAEEVHEIRADVHWEGADIECQGCTCDIESAYGDPDADRDGGVECD